MNKVHLVDVEESDSTILCLCGLMFYGEDGENLTDDPDHPNICLNCRKIWLKRKEEK